jgi:hypothetical protein
MANWSDGPDPPDVLCAGLSSKAIGVELTEWVEHNQVTAGAGRERLEKSYLKIIASEKKPRPSHIRQVLLYDKSLRIEADRVEFRNQLYRFITAENVKPLPLPSQRIIFGCVMALSPIAETSTWKLRYVQRIRPVK